MGQDSITWPLDRIRRTFIDYFVDRGHLEIPSASLIPDSPSTLLTGAGMQPLVPMFRGEAVPPAPRLVSCQKCARLGDIENVGKTARHHTFFEMLGNFSFGDYFKKGAIEFGWELVTESYGLPRDTLWATVYEEDDESFEIWNKHIGIPADRVLRCSKKDNWWPQTVWNGPCGPCTEIHVDQGPGIYPCDNPECDPACDCDRFLEFYNLVFQMYNQTEDGALSDLPKPGVDTGLGLERLAALLQGVRTNFDTDAFAPIIRATEAEVARGGGAFRYGEGDLLRDITNTSFRIVADHLRTVSFMIADRIMPANKGRGYVLRRTLRRALRYARTLGLNDPFLHRLVPSLLSSMGHIYPELVARREVIEATIRQEEERFCATLEQGMAILTDLIDSTRRASGCELPGKEVFRLYDTFGFPVEMTEEIAQESGLRIDRDGFEAALETQRTKSQFQFTESAAEKELYVELSRRHAATEADPESGPTVAAAILAIAGDGQELPALEEGESGALLLSRTCFYAEKGGQTGDHGMVRTSDGVFRVTDTQEPVAGVVLHIGSVENGTIRPGAECEVVLDTARRDAIRRAHSATHLLHRALRMVLGEDVAQAGSLVEPDRLRFDFTCPEPPSDEQLARVEDFANAQVLADLPVTIAETDRASAEAMGAIALFGEKYGTVVRVVKMGDYSCELCGGTHLSNTARVGQLRVLAESSIGAGIRRVEALTGLAALCHARTSDGVVGALARGLNARPDEIAGRVEALEASRQALARIAQQLGTDPDGVRDRIAALQQKVRDLGRALADGSAVASAAVAGPDQLLAAAAELAPGVKLVAANRGDVSQNELRELADQLAERPGIVCVLAAVQGDKIPLVCKLSKDLVERGLWAGDIIREVAAACDGAGGGGPAFARGSGKDPAKVDAAVAAAEGIVKAQLD